MKWLKWPNYYLLKSLRQSLVRWEQNGCVADVDYFEKFNSSTFGSQIEHIQLVFRITREPWIVHGRVSVGACWIDWRTTYRMSEENEEVWKRKILEPSVLRGRYHWSIQHTQLYFVIYPVWRFPQWAVHCGRSERKRRERLRKGCRRWMVVQLFYADSCSSSIGEGFILQHRMSTPFNGRDSHASWRILRPLSPRRGEQMRRRFIYSPFPPSRSPE